MTPSPAPAPAVGAVPSRRALLAGGLAAAGTVATHAAAAAPAEAAGTTYPVRSYAATSVPTALERHYLNRLGCGFSRPTFSRMRRAGGAAAWFEQQLEPAGVAESVKARALPEWYADLADDARTAWSRHTSGDKGGWVYAADLAGQSMMRRIYSHRQVLESMVDFWSNHLHVNSASDLGWIHRKDYDDVIRGHALGRFDDMLVAATLHPAMLLYLDNWRSVRGAPNENHGRELLELHTVGRAAGYTEQMVKDSATILSGWTVDGFASWEPRYDATRHTTGPVQVLGFSDANDATDGRRLTESYLRYLARHPATSRTIARKLARFFVADEPSTALVEHLAEVFRSSGTDIKATLRALVAHPDFYASRRALVRNPVEDFVAACRVMRVDAQAPTSRDAFAYNAIWSPQTTLLHQWPRPDGSPVGDTAWASPSRVLNSFRMHWGIVGGWWPRADVVYRAPGSWLPQPRLRFDAYVDHLCRVLLGRPSTRRSLGAAVAVTGTSPSTVVDADHAVAGWLHTRLAGALLDSPDHMRR